MTLILMLLINLEVCAIIFVLLEYVNGSYWMPTCTLLIKVL